MRAIDGRIRRDNQRGIKRSAHQHYITFGSRQQPSSKANTAPTKNIYEIRKGFQAILAESGQK